LNGRVTTQVEQLADNRVRLTVEVSQHQLEHAVEHATSDLAESVKIPGFRAGKVPRQVLVSRVGEDRIWTEAVDSHIGGWFWSAAAKTRLRPIAQPQYDYDLPGDSGQDWTFTATVEVQPTPDIVDWTTLEVPKAQAEVPDEVIEQELNALRETVAELAPVEGRPAATGDTLVVDLTSEDGESQTDTVVELGSGRLIEEIERALTGASAGDTRSATYELADGSTATVEITVKSVSEKILPELDDELARSASEFDTFEELRAEIEGRLLEQVQAQIDDAFRATAVDVLIRESGVQPAGPLVESRTRELATGFVRSLEQRGITPETYFSSTGVTPEALTTQLAQEAALSVARELTLEAVAERAGIEVSDDEVKELIREEAEAAGDDPDQVIEDIWEHGNHETLRDDLRLRAALDRLVDEVVPIAPEKAEAREQLWTPDKEKPKQETKKLWTPGSEEPE
jgi:trigger factor